MQKPKICHSKWGISHPGCFPDLSWINLDGTLNEPRVNYDSDVAKACGATMMRLLPCLVDDPELPRLPGAPENVKYNYTPWDYVETLNKWDLSRLNDRYFQNLYRICHILNEKGLSLIFSIYDRCHWDHGGRIPHSPWLWNVNEVTTFWNVFKAFTGKANYNELYEDRVLITLKGKDVYYELVNEPQQNDLNILAAFTGRLYRKLLNHGIPQDHIIGGVEFFLNSQINPIYAPWRLKTNFTDSKEGGTPENEVGFATVHNFMDVYENRHIVDSQVHSRKFMMSTDGNKTTEKEIYNAVTKFFSRKRPDQNESPRFIWEFLDQGIDRKTGKRTEKYGSRGIARAFRDYFYPNEQEWYSMNIDLVDPGNPERPPEKPVEKTIKIIYPASMSKIPKNNPGIEIKWEYTGDIKYVSIQELIETKWYDIVSKINNTGNFLWGKTGLLNENFIRVKDANGNSYDTVKFYGIEPEFQKPKSFISWLKKYWRWVLGVPAFIALGLIVLLSKSWEWRLAAYLASWALPYLRIVRK